MSQAKELLDHLEGVLSNQPVEVVQGNSIVEVKPQGISKGAVVDRLLIELSKRVDEHGQNSAPDFVLCIGDDRSDEDMFRAVEHVTVPVSSGKPAGEVGVSHQWFHQSRAANYPSIEPKLPNLIILQSESFQRG